MPQEAYYAFRAVFEPHQVRIERVPGQKDLLKDGLVRVFDAKPDEPTYLFMAGNEKLPDKANPLRPAVPDLFDLPLDAHSIDLPPVAVFPSLREFIEQEELAESERAHQQAVEQLETAEGGSETNGPDIETTRQRVDSTAAQLQSLRARWAADRAKYGRTANASFIAMLSATAALAGRRANLEHAKLAVLEKRTALAVEQEKDETDEAKKKSAIAAARKQLRQAETQLAKAP